MPLDISRYSDATKWQAMLLRLTGFPAERVSDQDWWQQVVAESPESVVSRKEASRRETSGQTELGRLSLITDLIGVNWVLTPVADDSILAKGEIPLLGPFPEQVCRFLDYLAKWYPACPRLKRIAVGAVLFQPAEDHESAYRLIAPYLPRVRLDPACRDFHYRVNWPRESKSGIPGLQLNRLATWSCIRFDVSVKVVGPVDIELRPNPRFGAHLDLDINTAQEFSGELLPDLLPPLVDELGTLALELAAQGDTP